MSQNEENFDENVEAFAEKQEAKATSHEAFAEKTESIDTSLEASIEKKETTDTDLEPAAETKETLIEDQHKIDEKQDFILESEDTTIDDSEVTINENDEATVELKPFYRSWLMYFLLVAFGLFIGTNLYFKSQIKINAPEVDLGKKVVVILQNGQEMKTYENLLVEKEKKIYYKGEFNTIDVTEGIIVYKDWE